ncbi:MAG: Prolipoprotein diacylglyceryl transferase [Ktedonobacterales bacterium]|jgi:phosphatidylglycerol:prolipoprotein diacylglycerol transferase|nr:MAG: Prolipoprotein diacylglyceryl transferase [Ktedonobacterales bacterium]
MQLSGVLHAHLSTLGFFVLNIDPVLFRLGPIAVHWYGLMYVVAISVALWALMRYSRKLGIHEEQLWSLFIWTAIAGLVGGRLYFVIQQPDLVNNYLLDPINIFAVWNGGMAFFGAVFFGTATLFLLAPRYGLSRWIAIDCGAFFAVIGQIFGRVGNVVNGDILGKVVSAHVAIPAGVCTQSPCIAYVSDPHILPWAIVYTNPNNTFATLGAAYHPAQVYEMLMNIAILAILLPLRFKLPRIRAGYFFIAYLALYAISQIVVFFARDTEPVTPFLGITAFKQAQWTGLVVLLLCIPLILIVRRFSAPWTYDTAHPVPLDGVAGVPTASVNSSRAVKSQLRPVKRAVPTLEPVDDLAPWEPTRVTGGGLRNILGPRS